MIVGARVAAIRIVGRGFMLERGLSGLALDTLDVAGKEIKEVFDVLAEQKQYPVLVHCTQGKDRTGLVVELVLLLLGISIEAIDHDYMLTVMQVASEREEKEKEVASIGLTEDFVRCDPKLIRRVEAHLNEKYGGVKAYLSGIGVSEEQQDKVREILSSQT
jgi:protein-tyrosine phosphatase